MDLVSLCTIIYGIKTDSRNFTWQIYHSGNVYILSSDFSKLLFMVQLESQTPVSKCEFELFGKTQFKDVEHA